MTEKSADYVHNGGKHYANDDMQFSVSGQQQEKPELEEKVWSLFGELEAAADKTEQEAIREKIWQLTEDNSDK
ncbi:hypothetical protein [Pantoea sp. PGP6]